MKKTALLFLTLVLVACTTVGASSEYESNLDKWQNANVNHYRFSLSVMCFCPDVQRMPLTVEVQNGQIVSIVDVDGVPVTPSDVNFEFFSQYATIDRIFSHLKADLEGGADEVSVNYDATYGFPTQVTIDRMKNAIDDELSITVSDFEVLQ